MKIDIKDALNLEGVSLFFPDPGNDTIAAAERLAATKKAFKEWHAAVNRTNVRSLPRNLVAEYGAAACALCWILAYEKEIIMKGGK